MQWTTPLTTDDLDRIAETAFTDPDPRAVAVNLIDAVERGAVPDMADTACALMLAAELAEHAGDLPAALALAHRAVEATRVHDPDLHEIRRSTRARMMMKAGQEREAMAEFTALRALLTSLPEASYFLPQDLEACGQAQLAEQWLTAALEAVRSCSSDTADTADLIQGLSVQRHELRRSLDLPHDELDELADTFAERLHDPALHGHGYAVLFWPPDEFDRIRVFWPALIEKYSGDWSEHRRQVETTLDVLTTAGDLEPALVFGTVEGLVRFAAASEQEPADPLVQQEYANHLRTQGASVPWPPGRKDPCWCGSGQRYKKCCGDRPSWLWRR